MGKNLFIKYAYLIGEIAEKTNCTIDVAQDKLKTDLATGEDTNTAGLIPPALRAEMLDYTADDLNKMDAEFFEHFKTLQDIGKPVDYSEFRR